MNLLKMLLFCDAFNAGLAPDPTEVPACKVMEHTGMAKEVPGMFYSVALTPDGARYARAADMFGMLED